MAWTRGYQYGAGAGTDRIVGYRGALAFVEQFPDTARKILKPAMRAADLVGKNAAEAEARAHTSDKPKRGGIPHLVTTTGAAEATLGNTVIGKVGFFGSGGQHGWLVEHGHRMVVGGTVIRINAARRDFGKAPYVWTKNAAGEKVLNKNLTGAGQVVGQVQPHPILLPAYLQSRSAMEQAFAAEVIARADKVATQLAKQTGAT